MLFTTATQWAALAVALIAGWLFGLASHPGGKKWKTRYVAEREAHAEARREHDARVMELERENATLRKAAPITAQTVAPHDDVPIERQDRARPAY